ncbi:MAG: hypothetical protein B7Y56_02885 [Gallionellales bacterium 35-53-114]|nr:MAG: hypothetical protein B7Y56_02885 [Gallionellales bacterium 35-53-114]OYZ65054.1 MAG: hypothetical protein B7Y04_00045 [Gallionellales bacterium 24-53-125]OZB07962.1 MAG: hypothetical protein B7X61_10495 [Gallionellales bacterium 39-52-133]HQS59700.1 hypothetical protein [Gallionellaceae bacterium]HQS76454.1 hypothetical protein [Gallionellaceae bacterium]
MANRAYLINHSQIAAIAAENSEESCLLGANYQVPILWIALFEPSDLTFVSVSCMNDNGDELIEKIPTLFAPTTKAKSTYAARSVALARSLGTENAHHISEWETFLSSNLPASMLQIDLAELWMMYENQTDLELDIREWLLGVKNPSGHEWENLCSQANLNDPEVRRYGLRGFPWQSKVQWT